MLPRCLLNEQAVSSMTHQWFNSFSNMAYVFTFDFFSLKSFVSRSITGKEKEEEILAYSNRDLFQRRDVDINGKTIVFRAMNGFNEWFQ